ncbi:MAG: lasso peptide [Candidatus Binatia bacterium]|jgi:hypothetical protein
MDAEKKRYTTPQLKVYGKLEEITQQNGSSVIDVPIGTPCCNNVAGS